MPCCAPGNVTTNVSVPKFSCRTSWNVWITAKRTPVSAQNVWITAKRTRFKKFLDLMVVPAPAWPGAPSPGLD